jgi:hypothetical protein
MVKSPGNRIAPKESHGSVKIAVICIIWGQSVSLVHP